MYKKITCIIIGAFKMTKFFGALLCWGIIYLVCAAIFGLIAGAIGVLILLYSYWEFCSDDKKLRKEREEEDAQEMALIKIENEIYLQETIEREKELKLEILDNDHIYDLTDENQRFGSYFADAFIEFNKLFFIPALLTPNFKPVSTKDFCEPLEDSNIAFSSSFKNFASANRLATVFRPRKST